MNEVIKIETEKSEMYLLQTENGENISAERFIEDGIFDARTSKVVLIGKSFGRWPTMDKNPAQTFLKLKYKYEMQEKYNGETKPE